MPLVSSLIILSRSREHAAQPCMQDFLNAWRAIVTPYQDIRAELASWPHGVWRLRMIRLLGAQQWCPGGGSFHVATVAEHIHVATRIGGN